MLLLAWSRRRDLGQRDVDQLPQQLPDKGNAFAAFRRGAEGLIDHRYRAVLAVRMGAEFAIGDCVAQADVHTAPLWKLPPFIYQACESFAIVPAMQKPDFGNA